jgi:hypothetical protein
VLHSKSRRGRTSLREAPKAVLLRRETSRRNEMGKPSSGQRDRAATREAYGLVGRRRARSASKPHRPLHLGNGGRFSARARYVPADVRYWLAGTRSAAANYQYHRGACRRRSDTPDGAARTMSCAETHRWLSTRSARCLSGIAREWTETVAAAPPMPRNLCADVVRGRREHLLAGGLLLRGSCRSRWGHFCGGCGSRV